MKRYILLYSSIFSLPIPVEKIVPKFRLWLEYEGKPILGKGGYEILDAIEKYGSVSMATKVTGYSYRFVLNYLKKIKERTGEPAIEAFKGGAREGRKGGGGAKLTETGKQLLAEYRRFEELLRIALETRG